MHRRRILYNGAYPSFPYGHHGADVYSSYDIAQPLPSLGVSPYYHDYGYRRSVAYADYPYYDYASRTLPPIVHTNVHNNIHYYYDEPDIIYDNAYSYRLPRSKVQVVNYGPRNYVRTYRPRETVERIIVPRSTVLRHTSLPAYERANPVLMPLYRSANARYIL
jgi:hypothetical protein